MPGFESRRLHSFYQSSVPSCASLSHSPLIIYRFDRVLLSLPAVVTLGGLGRTVPHEHRHAVVQAILSEGPSAIAELELDFQFLLDHLLGLPDRIARHRTVSLVERKEHNIAGDLILHQPELSGNQIVLDERPDDLGNGDRTGMSVIKGHPRFDESRKLISTIRAILNDGENVFLDVDGDTILGRGQHLITTDLSLSQT